MGSPEMAGNVLGVIGWLCSILCAGCMTVCIASLRLISSSLTQSGQAWVPCCFVRADPGKAHWLMASTCRRDIMPVGRYVPLRLRSNMSLVGLLARGTGLRPCRTHLSLSPSKYIGGDMVGVLRGITATVFCSSSFTRWIASGETRSAGPRGGTAAVLSSSSRMRSATAPSY